MLAVLFALFVFILLGLGLTYWLRQSHAARQPAEMRARSAEQLSKLRWRDFAKLVLQAMHGRGLHPVLEAGLPADGIPTDGSDILLERDGEYTLLSCKYGSASVVGATALLGLAKSATLRGAERVIVVTPGRFDDEAERIAQQQEIELIDGETLWPEVRPYVAYPADAAAVQAPAAARIESKRLGLAWGSAAVASLLTWMLATSLLPANDTADMPPQSTASLAPHTRNVGKPDPDTVIPTDPAVLEQRRRETANAIATLFGVSRAIWSTQSTLLVYLSSEEANPINELCPLLERYPELAPSRVQLQPPSGSNKPVRFKQCRTY